MTSKLSVHQERPSASARAYVEAGCNVLKLVSDFGLSFDIASGKVIPGNPNLIVIGRMVSAFNAHDQRGEVPEDAAVKFVNSQKETYRLNPHIKVWEGHNEFNPATIEDVEWWARFEVARVELLWQIGLRSVVGNFSTGVPDVEWWDAFVPAIKVADYVGIHEYIAGPMLDENGNIREPFGLLRHELIYNRVFAPNKVKAHIIATEFGILGYRDFMQGREYARQIIEVDRRLMATPYFDGACIFTHGSANSAWDSFNVDGDADFIDATTAHIRSHLNDTEPPMPEPEPDPIKTFPPNATVKTTATLLNFRTQPAVDPDGDNIITTLPRGTVMSVEQSPIVTDRRDWAKADAILKVSGYVAGEFLELADVPPVPEPEPELPRVVYSNDWTHGQAAIPGHDNIRVPLDEDGSQFEIEYLDGTTDPRLPDSDPTSLDSIWLAPESTMRSGDTVKYPFTERLPDSELDLYLAPDSPIADHFFKRYGKQWWKLTKSLALPAGRYRFSVEVYPDIYSGPHVWAPDPISGEYRAIAGNESNPFSNGNFGRWIELNITINHLGGFLKHGVEFRARYGVETVGLFIRRWKVERIE